MKTFSVTVWHTESNTRHYVEVNASNRKEAIKIVREATLRLRIETGKETFSKFRVIGGDF
tara:strand:- start:332 stop:511 length:180 start_codon:yes stop_codon:yes gene_type:complete